MPSTQVVETSVNVIRFVILNSPSQDYSHPDDRTSLNYDNYDCWVQAIYDLALRSGYDRAWFPYDRNDYGNSTQTIANDRDVDRLEFYPDDRGCLSRPGIVSDRLDGVSII